mmetsp:Transcript_42653/g.110258  ORF Transcript_42653/g.110258 Transcript_42653/m.110258 type:complete len:242 (-) Transcript_42653:94-819(-)
MAVVRPGAEPEYGVHNDGHDHEAPDALDADDHQRVHVQVHQKLLLHNDLRRRDHLGAQREADADGHQEVVATLRLLLARRVGRREQRGSAHEPNANHCQADAEPVEAMELCAQHDACQDRGEHDLSTTEHLPDARRDQDYADQGEAHGHQVEHGRDAYHHVVVHGVALLLLCNQRSAEAVLARGPLLPAIGQDRERHAEEHRPVTEGRLDEELRLAILADALRREEDLRDDRVVGAQDEEA